MNQHCRYSQCWCLLTAEGQLTQCLFQPRQFLFRDWVLLSLTLTPHHLLQNPTLVAVPPKTYRFGLAVVCRHSCCYFFFSVEIIKEVSYKCWKILVRVVRIVTMHLRIIKLLGVGFSAGQLFFLKEPNRATLYSPNIPSGLKKSSSPLHNHSIRLPCTNIFS